MSPHQKKQLSWLEYESQRTGKTVEQVRESMRARSKLADKSKSGFAYLKQHDPKRLKAITSKGGSSGKQK